MTMIVKNFKKQNTCGDGNYSQSQIYL